MKGLVTDFKKLSVVICWWKSKKQKLGFINQVDLVNQPPERNDKTDV